MNLKLNKSKAMYVSSGNKTDMVLPSIRISILGLLHVNDTDKEIKGYHVTVCFDIEKSITLTYYIFDSDKVILANEKLKNCEDVDALYFVNEAFEYLNIDTFTSFLNGFY